ncbi:probable G10 protein [Claviceps purpurea 20.1]|uniref:Probable G10 protein n=1 Tax=Claviceps purpurea (strain 20.1) TaxID=1111077 RepID=M1W761_CLAP2|nr:probable G10 protein [Claviceps purpurea 20.1]
MPAIRPSSKRKPPPDGFSDIENDLLIFSNKMKDAQNKPAPAGPKHQAQWEIFQISHQRSRYVYDLYYEKEAISKQLYNWLLKNGSVAFDVCKRKRQTSTVLAYVESRGSSSRKVKKTDNVLAVDVEGAPPAIEWIMRQRC